MRLFPWFVNIIAIADLALAMATVGFVGAYVQAAVRGRHDRLKMVPFWLIIAAIPTAIIVTLVVPSSVRWAMSGGLSTGQDGMVRHIARMWAIMLVLLAMCALTAGAWERLRRFGFKRMVQSIGRLVPHAASCVLLAWLMLWMVAPTAGISEGAVPDDVVPEPPAFLLILMAAVNATVIGRALGAKGLDRIAFSLAAIIPTLIAMPLSLWLFLNVFGGGELGWEMARAMVGVSESGDSGVIALMAWWMAVYLIAVFAMGGGVAIGLKRGAAFEHRLERNALQHVHAASETLAASVGATLADDRKARERLAAADAKADPALPDSSVNGQV